MKRTTTCVTSLAALMLAAPLAFAQDKPAQQQDRGPSQMENKAGGSERGLERSGGQRNEKAGDTARERAGSGAERNQAGDEARDQAKERQRKDARDDAREQRKDAKDEKKSGDERSKQGDRNERAGSDQDRTKSQDKAEDRKQQDKSRNQAGDADRDRQRTQDQARDHDQAKDRQSDEARGEVREEDRQKAEQVRSKVDTKERDRVREVAFRGDVRRASNVDIRVDIGVRLPRQVEIYDLPSDIVEIVPAYRGYRYIVIGDDYCIIDPDTYVIVDVIHRGGDRGQYAYRTGGGSARLELTNDQIEIIRREIRDRGRSFDYQGDLEVGIRLPGDFAFEPFPETVVREVPVVRDYRFVHIEDEIAIVAKDQPEVVFVFED